MDFIKNVEIQAKSRPLLEIYVKKVIMHKKQTCSQPKFSICFVYLPQIQVFLITRNECAVAEKKVIFPAYRGKMRKFNRDMQENIQIAYCI